MHCYRQTAMSNTKEAIAGTVSVRVKARGLFLYPGTKCLPPSFDTQSQNSGSDRIRLFRRLDRTEVRFAKRDTSCSRFEPRPQTDSSFRAGIGAGRLMELPLTA